MGVVFQPSNQEQPPPSSTATTTPVPGGGLTSTELWTGSTGLMVNPTTCTAMRTVSPSMSTGTPSSQSSGISSGMTWTAPDWQGTSVPRDVMTARRINVILLQLNNKEIKRFFITLPK